jgi:hypothetical protein
MKKIALLVLAFALPAAAFAATPQVTLTLQGGSVSITSAQSYSEPGFSAFSTVDGDITGNVQVSGVDTSIGDHTITYYVQDSTFIDPITTPDAFATASRALTVVASGSGMIPCSGPLAPGWNVSLPGGGCGGTDTLFRVNQPMPDGTTCAFFSGCMVKE